MLHKHQKQIIVRFTFSVQASTRVLFSFRIAIDFDVISPNVTIFNVTSRKVAGSPSLVVFLGW